MRIEILRVLTADTMRRVGYSASHGAVREVANFCDGKSDVRENVEEIKGNI
jgi:Lhr-like helicase